MAKSNQFTVDNVALKIASSNGSPVAVSIHAGDVLYVGGSDVTTANGFMVHKDSTITLTIADHQELWAIHSAGSPAIAYVLECIV